MILRDILRVLCYSRDLSTIKGFMLLQGSVRYQVFFNYYIDKRVFMLLQVSINYQSFMLLQGSVNT